MKCEKCDHEFNYDDPSGTRTYYVIEKRNEVVRGPTETIAYCSGCAPFGNTSVPEKLQ